MKAPWRSLFLAALCIGAGPATMDYRAEIEAWRTAREARLKADGGWLTVAGLFWLKEGDNRFGSDNGNEIVLPPSAPAHAGVLTFASRETRFRLNDGVVATVDGKSATSGVLKPDEDTDVMTLGRLTLQVIERGGRYGIRLKDLDSHQRKAFAGLRWYPVKESYRITARFTPKPGSIGVTNVLGQVEEMPRPGTLTFTLNGREASLDPVIEEPDAKELFIIFRDETAPKETYGAGRFLYADMPKDGKVVLDFNKAYTPPCGFTAYATCPLPPKQNRLPLRIEAGELRPQVVP